MRRHMWVNRLLLGCVFLLVCSFATSASAGIISGDVDLTARFTAVFHSPNAWDPKTGQVSTWKIAVAEFTPAGPIEGTIRPIPDSDIAQVTLDPASGEYYGTGSRGVYLVNPATGRTALFHELSWIGGVTFDTKRGRLVTGHDSGVGDLLTYAPQQKKWSVLASLDGIDIQALAYSPADDCYYALAGLRTNVPNAIYQFDPEGVLKKTIELPLAAKTPEHGTKWPYQLIVAGEQLAVITPPVPDLFDPLQPYLPHSLLIDPDTGRVTYYDTISIVPEPSSGLLLLGSLLLFRRRPSTC